MKSTGIFRACLLASLVAAGMALPALARDTKHARPAKPAQNANPAAAQPWMNLALPPGERAALLEKELTQAERINLVRGLAGMPFPKEKPEGAAGGAGYIPAIPRLGIPALQESDASLGVANPMMVRPNDRATPLPSGLTTGATFDPKLAYDGGAMIGQEAWREGFNVLLAGGANLTRDPRNGRNFEYLSEDPLLTGTMAGEAIRGIQDQHVISTTKHFVINDQETGRGWANAKIDEAALRESDLLAFELAIERGHPGSVMCSYNQINGAFGCGNNHTLNEVLKGDWSYPGWVMSDWGAVHDVNYAVAGLDQQSAAAFDFQPFFDKPLLDAIAKGTIPAERLPDMTRRILRSMFAIGLFENPPVRGAIDFKADAEVAKRVAESGIVLLKNSDGILPLSQNVKRIAVIGGHADSGVLSGGGSSQVIPEGKSFLRIPFGDGILETSFNGAIVYDPSSPLAAIKAKTAGAEVRFYDGRYASSAAKLAKWADVAIVFGEQWMSEGIDAPDLSLPNGQDALIAAVAGANPKTIVVLETGGPTAMPWLDKAGAVLQAWYPGARGGEAIANILFGSVNPSGRLPITFPRNLEQNPRPVIPGSDEPEPQFMPGVKFEVPKLDILYTEGSDAGYRWFAKNNLKPLFAFGYGLSYTSFDFKNLKVDGGHTLTVSFDVTNTGSVAGAAVPQVYLTNIADKSLLRLIGFSKVPLEPGRTQRVSVTADPRLLAHFDAAAHNWRIDAGNYDVAVARSATDGVLKGSAAVEASTIKP